jgi:hypothetical protein
MHYPLFYNFIVDFFEDPDSDDEDLELEEHVENQHGIELLQWWNRYDQFCPGMDRFSDVTVCSSQIFHTTANLSSNALARQALKTSQHKLRESRARFIGA